MEKALKIVSKKQIIIAGSILALPILLPCIAGLLWGISETLSDVGLISTVYALFGIY